MNMLALLFQELGHDSAMMLVYNLIDIPNPFAHIPEHFHSTDANTEMMYQLAHTHSQLLLVPFLLTSWKMLIDIKLP